jgi:DNA-binding IscR family transcriptional regulator
VPPLPMAFCSKLKVRGFSSLRHGRAAHLAVASAIGQGIAPGPTPESSDSSEPPWAGSLLVENMTALHRFTVATHALALAQLGHQLGVEPAPLAPPHGPSPAPQVHDLRRVADALVHAGLITIQPGSGGWRLACDPTRLTLLDVYRAVGGERPVTPHAQAQDDSAHNSHASPEPVPNAALISRLARITIADIVAAACARVPGLEFLECS